MTCQYVKLMLPLDDEDWIQARSCLKSFLCIGGWDRVGVLEELLLMQCVWRE